MNTSDLSSATGHNETPKSVSHPASRREKTSKVKRDWETPEWTNFLLNLPNVPSVEDDDENDPEYNFDETVEEEEEFREPPSVGRQELLALLEDLIHQPPERDGRTSDVRRSALTTPLPLLDETEPMVASTSSGSIADELHFEPQTPWSYETADTSALVRESGDLLIDGVLPLLSEFERLQLAEQLRKHVQLLTQSFVICKEIRGDGAKEIIEIVEESLNQLRQQSVCFGRSSMFHIWNLPVAFETLERIKRVESEPKVPLLSGKNDLISVRTAEIIGNSTAFLYSMCLPEDFIRIKARQFRKDKPRGYTGAEVELLALSYAQFRRATTSDVNLCRLIQENCLPHRSVESLRHQISRLISPSCGMNPVKMAAKGRAPKENARCVQLFDPNCVYSPLDQVTDESPNWLKRLKALHISRETSSRCSTPRRFPTSSDSSVIRPQSCPAQTSNSVGFSGVLRNTSGESVLVQITGEDIKVSPVDANSLIATPTLTSNMWATVPTAKIALPRNFSADRLVFAPTSCGSPLISSTPSTSEVATSSQQSDVKKKRPYKPREKPRKPKNPWSKRRKISGSDTRSVTDSQSTDVSSNFDGTENGSHTFGYLQEDQYRHDDLLVCGEESLNFNSEVIVRIPQTENQQIVTANPMELPAESLILGFSLNDSNSAITTTPVKRHNFVESFNFTNSTLKTPPKGQESPNKPRGFGSGMKLKNPFSPKSPLKWKEIVRLSAQNPQKHRIGAELESPIKPSTPYSPNSLRTPPTVKFSAEMDMESLRKSEDVFKMPKHHSRIRAKRSKIQLANESLAALQQEVDVDRIGEIMASCFQTELSKALYMHKGILEKILQSFTEFVGRKEELIVQLINTLCDQTVSGPSTNFLCEMLIYFLNAEEAEKLGCYNKFLQFHEAHKFLWKLSRFITVRKGAHASRVIKMLKMWLCSNRCLDGESLKQKLAEIIGSDNPMWSDLLRLFPNESASKLNSEMGDRFEVIRETDVLGSPEKTEVDKYERISLTVTKPPGYANVGTKMCSCDCHTTGKQINSPLHCSLCSVKFVVGAVHALSNGEFRYGQVDWVNKENETSSCSQEPLTMQTPDLSCLVLRNVPNLSEEANVTTLEPTDCSSTSSTQDLLKKAVRMCLDLNSHQSPVKETSHSNETAVNPAADNSVFIRGPEGMDLMFPHGLGPPGEVLRSRENSMMEVITASSNQTPTVSQSLALSSTMDGYSSVTFPANLYETTSQTGDICGANGNDQSASLMQEISSSSQPVQTQELRDSSSWAYGDDYFILMKLQDRLEISTIVQSVVERTNREPLEVEKRVRFLSELMNEAEV